MIDHKPGAACVKNGDGKIEEIGNESAQSRREHLGAQRRGFRKRRYNVTLPLKVGEFAFLNVTNPLHVTDRPLQIGAKAPENTGISEVKTK